MLTGVGVGYIVFGPSGSRLDASFIQLLILCVEFLALVTAPFGLISTIYILATIRSFREPVWERPGPLIAILLWGTILFASLLYLALAGVMRGF